MREYIVIAHRISCKWVIFLLLFVLAACSSTQGPVVIRESSIPAGADRDAKTKESATVSVHPVAPEQQKTVIPLVEKLVDQSNEEVKNKNYERAISLAERGLRINRKDSRLYLILSKAHRGSLNYKQSVYFAKQGLRYADKSGDVYQALIDLAGVVN